jgi:protein-S-isoprenylcysteine O-methyltransferase Ste14
MSAAAVRPYVVAHHAVGPVWALTIGAMIAVELTVAFRRRPGSARDDGGSHLALVGGIGGGIVVLVLSRRIGGWSVIRPPVASAILGEVLCVLGIALRAWSIRTLGAYFTTTVRTTPDQPVVTGGPYRWVRHPSYTALLMFLAGAGFVVGNWVGLGAVVAGSTAGLAYRIRVEEAALVAAVGEPYRAFAATRRRLVPGVW